MSRIAAVVLAAGAATRFGVAEAAPPPPARPRASRGEPRRRGRRGRGGVRPWQQPVARSRAPRPLRGLGARAGSLAPLRPGGARRRRRGGARDHGRRARPRAGGCRAGDRQLARRGRRRGRRVVRRHAGSSAPRLAGGLGRRARRGPARPRAASRPVRRPRRTRRRGHAQRGPHRELDAVSATGSRILALCRGRGSSSRSSRSSSPPARAHAPRPHRHRPPSSPATFRSSCSIRPSRCVPAPVDGFLADADLERRATSGWEPASGPLPPGGADLRLDQRACAAIDGPAGDAVLRVGRGSAWRSAGRLRGGAARARSGSSSSTGSGTPGTSTARPCRRASSGRCTRATGRSSPSSSTPPAGRPSSGTPSTARASGATGPGRRSRELHPLSVRRARVARELPDPGVAARSTRASSTRCSSPSSARTARRRSTTRAGDGSCGRVSCVSPRRARPGWRSPVDGGGRLPARPRGRAAALLGDRAEGAGIPRAVAQARRGGPELAARVTGTGADRRRLVASRSVGRIARGWYLATVSLRVVRSDGTLSVARRARRHRLGRDRARVPRPGRRRLLDRGDVARRDHRGRRRVPRDARRDVLRRRARGRRAPRCSTDGTRPSAAAPPSRRSVSGRSPAGRSCSRPSTSLIQALRSRAGIIGSLLLGAATVAWGLATFLVVPIVALEGLGPARGARPLGVAVPTEVGRAARRDGVDRPAVRAARHAPRRCADVPRLRVRLEHARDRADRPSAS